MNDKEPHVMVGEWLLKMGYSKDKFPSDEQLKKVCRGSIYRCFWKEVVKNVKPKQEITFIKENIFVDSIRRYERVQETTKAKLGQVLPPEPLHLWRKTKENNSTIAKTKAHQERSEHNLSDKLLNLKMKSYKNEEMKKTLTDKQREVHLLNETIHQFNEEIKQNKYLVDVLCNVPCLKDKVKETVENDAEIDVLADFLSTTSLKSPENTVHDNNSISDPYDDLFCIKEDDSNINVEKLMKNIKMATLFEKLMIKRDEMIQAVVSDNKVEEELKKVEDDARSKGVLPWKEGLSRLSLMHCNVVIATLQNRKDLHPLLKRFKNVLSKKVAEAKLPDQTIEVVVLKCRNADLSGQISTYKDLYNELFHGSDLFSKDISVNPSNNCMRESIVNVRDDIVSLFSLYGSKQTQALENINKLCESIPIMKELKKSFLDFIGHSEYSAFERNESLNMSFFNPNTTFKTSVSQTSKNLIDIKFMFSEANAIQQIKQDVYDVCKLRLKEMKMFKDFDLSRNRKIVLKNGAKLWIDETLRGFQRFDLNDQYILFKFLNPLQLATGIIGRLENKIAWKKSLEEMAVLIDKKQPKVLPQLDNQSISLDEDSDPRYDLVLKKAKTCYKPLSSMRESVKAISRKVAFLTKTDFRKLISSERTYEGKPYYELEDDIKKILAEEAYWKH